jgi:hypothetical protein
MDDQQRQAYVTRIRAGGLSALKAFELAVRREEKREVLDELRRRVKDRFPVERDSA